MSGESFFWPTPWGRLSGLCWRPGSTARHRVLAVHGWQDNAASFSVLGTMLAHVGYEVWAVDLPGHGYSDPLPPGSGYMLADYLPTLLSALDAQGDSRWLYLGHSLGAVLGLLVQAAAPSRFFAGVWIDAIGPMVTPPGETVKQFRRAIQARMNTDAVPPRGFGSVREAAQIRAARFTPHDCEMAERILARNLTQRDEGWVLHTDPRIRWPSTFRLTESQVEALMRAIEQPVLVLGADKGLVRKPGPRVNWLSQGKFVSLKGAHHLHMDQNGAEAVTHEIMQFAD